MAEGKVAGTFTARITLREPELFDAPPPGGDMYPPDEAALRLPTGVGLENQIKRDLQRELEANGSALIVASVHVERTDS